MEITYTKQGDYLLPDLTLKETKKGIINKYGRMRLAYLKEYKKAVIVVSHDRAFLDNFVNVVYEIERHKIKRYVGNYSDFVKQKKKEDIEWWTDFQDIRIFYKTNHLYYNYKSGDVTPIVPAEEYAEDYFVFDGYPLFLNLHTTHNLEAAQKYLQDGTIPSDDT